MPIVHTPFYKKEEPKEEVIVSSVPRWGYGIVENVQDQSELSSALQNQHDTYETGSLSVFGAGGDDFYYYLSPIELGAVTFKDTNGFVGGWDGASWPTDDMGEVYGPVVVYYYGAQYNLYRTDWPGNGDMNFNLTFENL